MMRSIGSVLIFVEDPGACNYLRELPKHLSDVGIVANLLSSGAGVDYLNSRGVSFTEVHESETASALLDRHLPSLVMVGTSEVATSLAHQLREVCRDRGIVTVGAVDMEANADRRFRGLTDSPLAHAPDWLLVPDESCKQKFAELGFPREKIIVAGHPHFDYVRNVAAELDMRRDELKTRLLPKTVDGPIVTFICEGYDLLNRSASFRSSEYTLQGRGGTDFRTAIVLEELLDALKTIKPRPFVIVRLHPKMCGDELLDYVDEIDFVSRIEEPLELLAVSDLIVGMSSMLLQEAAIMGKCTLSIVPRPCEKLWLSTTATGYTPCITEKRDLKRVLRNLDDGIMRQRHEGLAYKPNALSTIARFIAATFFDSLH